MPGSFNTSNDGWRLTILDSASQVVYGPAGEGSLLYPGSGVNNREIYRLETEPTASVTPASPQDDGTHSTFGSFNRWKDADLCKLFQSIAEVRTGPLSECDTCARLVLNAYNGVADDMFLNGGDAQLDQDGGQAADTFFGRVLGNGRDWFELVVIENHLDARGWTLAWDELTFGTTGTIVLSNDPFWSDLPAGMIITVIENSTAQGGLDTDVSYAPGAGDTWVNINTFDTTYVAQTTSNEPGHVSGQFSVSSKDWQLTVKDGFGAGVFGPAGEGSFYYYQDGVNQRNIFRLEEDPSPGINLVSAYDDGSSSSTFGAANQWTLCPSLTVVTQDFTGLPDPSCSGQPACPWDCDGSADGNANVSDLLALLGQWDAGSPINCTGGSCDFNGDGCTDVVDLLKLLGNYATDPSGVGCP